MNKWVKTVPKLKLYSEFVQALNGILKLTNRQLELLAALIYIDVNTPKSVNVRKNVISTENRKKLNKMTGIDIFNICKYIKKFKQMGLLVNGRAEDEVFVTKALVPEIVGDRVQVTIVLRINNEQETKE